MSYNPYYTGGSGFASGGSSYIPNPSGWYRPTPQQQPPDYSGYSNPYTEGGWQIDLANQTNNAWINERKPWESTDSWYNPITGERHKGGVDPQQGMAYGGGAGGNNWEDFFGGLKSLFRGAAGGTNLPNYQQFSVTPWGGGGTQPEPWSQVNVNAPGGYTPGSIDPRTTATQDAINAQLPWIQEQQDIGFADAAQRAGQSGFAMSTPYMEALGGVARQASNDTQAMAQQFLFQAEESARQRELQAAMQEEANRFGAWQQQGNWDLNSQLANAGNSLNAWQTQGGWGQQGQDRDLQAWMMQNQLGMQNAQGQNDWNLASWQSQQQQNMMNQQNQQQLMMQLLGMYGSGMFGGGMGGF